MSARQKHDKTYVFSEMPPGRTVAYLVVPTVLTQAIGQKRRPYILAFTRMGTVDVLFMCACNALLGAPGVGRRCQAGAAKALQTVLHQLNQQAILACHQHVIRLRRRSPQPRSVLPGVQRGVAAYRQEAGGAAGAVQGLALLQAGV